MTTFYRRHGGDITGLKIGTGTATGWALALLILLLRDTKYIKQSLRVLFINRLYAQICLSRGFDAIWPLCLAIFWEHKLFY